MKLTSLVRELGIQTPVLLYSARTWTSVDVARALDAGADDYLEAPLERFDELVARVRALARRSRGTGPLQRLRVGGFDLDVLGRRATFAGADLTVTRVQFELLAHFAAHAERVLTYDALYAFLHGHTRASKNERAHVVHEAVRRLRARIGEAAASHIVTVAGVGYRFSA